MSKMISDWLDKYGTIEINSFVEKNLIISEKVQTSLDEKGWSRDKFAEALHITTTELSKWLSGTYNLTLKNIIKMETVLEINIIFDGE